MRHYWMTVLDHGHRSVMWPPPIISTPYHAAQAALVCWKRVYGEGGRPSGHGRLRWHGKGMAEVIDQRGRSIMLEQIDHDPSVFLPSSISAQLRHRTRGPLALLPEASERPKVGFPLMTAPAIRPRLWKQMNGIVA